MININLVVVGKIKESFHREEISELVKRLSKYCKVSTKEVTPVVYKDESSQIIKMILNKEGESLLKLIKDDAYVFLLDLHGKEISSEEFTFKLDNLIGSGKNNITFVIGGSYGLSDKVRERSNFAIKLSPMTFTHQMTRIIILEQIYRSFKIINHETYHK